MTLEEAEARSGVSTSSLSAYERGEGNPTLRTVMLLAESYQVPLSGLLREKDREPDCIGWLESILRTDRADGGQENEDKAGKGSLEEG